MCDKQIDLLIELGAFIKEKEADSVFIAKPFIERFEIIEEKILELRFKFFPNLIFS